MFINTNERVKHLEGDLRNNLKFRQVGFLNKQNLKKSIEKLKLSLNHNQFIESPSYLPTDHLQTESAVSSENFLNDKRLCSFYKNKNDNLRKEIIYVKENLKRDLQFSHAVTPSSKSFLKSEKERNHKFYISHDTKKEIYSPRFVKIRNLKLGNNFQDLLFDSSDYQRDYKISNEQLNTHITNREVTNYSDYLRKIPTNMSLKFNF